MDASIKPYQNRHLNFLIRPVTKDDIPLLLSFIRELAEYEKLSHAVSATEEILQESFFGEHPAAETVFGYFGDVPVSFAIFFHNFSSFQGRAGLYLEDLYVKPEYRGKGFGKEMFLYLARIASERGCGRFEWSVLDWNEPAIDFYMSHGAIPMDEWTVYRLTGESLNRLSDMPLTTCGGAKASALSALSEGAPTRAPSI